MGSDEQAKPNVTGFSWVVFRDPQPTKDAIALLDFHLTQLLYPYSIAFATASLS